MVGVIYVVLTFYASQLLAGIAVSIYPLVKHWTNAQANSWLNNSVLAQFFYILFAESLAIGAIYLFLRHHKTGFKSIGLRQPRWADLGYAIAGAIVYYVIFFAAASALSSLVHSFNANQTQEIGFNNVHGGLQLTLTFASLVILPPLTEEIMVRGLLFSSLRKALPLLQAGLITSVIFAAAHLPEGGAAGPLWIGALDTFILSLVLVYLREKTQSLAASIMLHAIKNGFAFLALFVFHLS